MLDFVDGYSAQFIYFLLFFLLFLCGIGFPMAEELVLLAGGVLVASGVLNPLLMLFSTFLGVMIGDVLLFRLGRGLAAHVTASASLTRWFSRRRLARGKAFFARHGRATIFLVRFVPGLRAPTFLFAGTMQMGLWRFVAIDTLAALIFIPMMCGAGYLFADQVEVVAAWFKSFERAIFTLLFITSLSWLIWRYRSRRANPVTTPPPDAVDWS